MEPNDQQGAGEKVAAEVAGTTAGEAKERLSELLFAMSVFFGLLHFVGIGGQVAIMFLHTGLGIEVSFPLRSSVLMGNIYLGFLAAYVGRKEYLRWFVNDREVLPKYVLLKMTRGEVIIACWGILTGITVFLYGLSYIGEVPDILLVTMGEVLALWVGSDVLKYFKTKSSAVKQETESHVASFGDRVLDYVREHGSIDCGEACKEYGLSEDQSYRLLKKLVWDRKLAEYGEKRGRRYKLP